MQIGATSKPHLVLSEANWNEREQIHQALVEPIISDFQQRRQQHIRQPVIDFLFEYYQCNRKWLANWRPGLGVAVEGASATKFLDDSRYRRNGKIIYLDKSQVDPKTRERAKWIKNLLQSVNSRPPQFNCFGLHEWAMVYKCEQIRHESTPLRVTMDKVSEIVESHPIRCSHYDAFRFFTPQARPLNNLNPTLETRPESEQSGCLHFNMDLYKWCYKLAPWTSAELTRDCFLHAIHAREIDMRASPYDVSHLGLDPILIETTSGKAEYQQSQANIREKGNLLAQELSKALEQIIS